MITKKKRNLTNTRQKIVDAFRTILATQGIDKVTVQSIAEEAGVSRVLIYRYFGGVDGLIEHYIQEGDLYPKLTNGELNILQEIFADNPQKVWHHRFKQISVNYKDSKEYKALIRATMSSNEETVGKISTSIDGEIQKFFSQLSPMKNLDMDAVLAILIGGLSYMSILESNNRSFLGIDLSTEDSWKRIDETMKTIFYSLGKN